MSVQYVLWCHTHKRVSLEQNGLRILILVAHKPVRTHEADQIRAPVGVPTRPDDADSLSEDSEVRQVTKKSTMEVNGETFEIYGKTVIRENLLKSTGMRRTMQQGHLMKLLQTAGHLMELLNWPTMATQRRSSVSSTQQSPTTNCK
jgi:hypothetical protein